jgi:hypothetical protein
VLDGDEQCDDAGESAACNADCTPSSCGDGVANAAAGEQCDDAGESAACNADCSSALCGDGKVNASAGELCDASGASASCDVDCTDVVCGDGLLNPEAGEQCDAGGATADCDADCTEVDCGDGNINGAAGEQCDDGGESATCDADCTTAVCGDGVVNPSASEQCDGGNDCDPATCAFVSNCVLDPVGAALEACAASYGNCVVVNGGVVGFDPPFSQPSNCGLPADPWRFYCTADDPAGTNYNCSPCSLGDVLGPHDPCNCDDGTSPLLDDFC